MPKRNKSMKGKGRSGYKEKLQKRKTSIYQAPVESGEEAFIDTKIIQIPQKESSPKTYRNISGFMEAEDGTHVGIGFLPDPRAIRITPYIEDREIYSFMFRDNGTGPTYSILKRNNNGTCSSKRTFSRLYETNWLNEKGKKELHLIERIFRLRIIDIEKHTGLEIISN